MINDNIDYINDIKETSSLNIDWDILKNKTFLITGATGLIGKYLIDTIMYKNEVDELNCKVLAVGRSIEKAKKRFKNCFDNANFKFYELDINEKIIIDEKYIDYIFHAASSTHPIDYSTNPIKTITANVIGTKNILDLAIEHYTKRVIFASSVEIYGETRNDVEKFNEEYLGYINCNTLRAGYPESKRTGEALCQAYIKEKKLDIVIPRLSRVFGPTVLETDSKALSQFIKKAVNDEDIVLKSEGNQFYSYIYVGDAVSAILYVLMYGKNGEAYNVSNEKFDITLKELAFLIASHVNKKVVFELPDEEEKKGYSKATKAIMDSKKIENLGWTISKSIKERVEETIDILKTLK